jgi:drug/metabolite transporter (DMT)-like permease
MWFELSVLFAFCAMLCWGIGDFLIQKSVRKTGNIACHAFIGVIGTIILFPFIIKDLNIIFTNGNWIILAFSGVLAFLVGLINFKAFKEGKLAIVDVLLEIELPIAVILGVLVFKEKININQYLLMGAVLIGLILIAFRSGKYKFERGAVLALIAGIGLGLVDFVIAHVSKDISPLIAIWSAWFVIALSALAYIIKEGKINKLKKDFINYKALIISMSIIDTFAWLFYAFALSEGSLSLTTAITEAYPVIALFLGVWINKESIQKHQYLGIIITLIAVITLAINI